MTRLRIMTYNVRYFGHATRGLASTARSLQGIAQAIARQEPPLDLILLQEVETASLRSTLLHARQRPEDTQLDRLLQALHQALRGLGRHDVYEGYYFPAHNYALGKSVSLYTTGLAILVRHPLRVVHHNGGEPHDITHRNLLGLRRSHAAPPSGKKPWLKQTRICAHLAVEAGGQVIDVFNTHLSLPSFLDPNFWRRPERMGHGPNQCEEVKKLQEFIDAKRSSERFLVAGDFNALPGSPVYIQMTRGRQLHDPLLSQVGDIEALKRFPTAGFLQFRMHLDHLFSGPGLRWLDLEGSYPFDDPASPFRGLSDHSPLLGHFSI
ncbi:MAG: endonuclease/exonuclease/phosphatase family protein [Myxococcales bacterium]|nr:endonuclease/exonuclease/phosphatase family protein [Polyangiaceae bacterium]MDW8249830.1 endonuclease/exonuclease/phosphatase family protein [Myxococcales bacterium]